MNFMSPKKKLGAIAMILGLCVVAEAKVITVTNSNDHLAGTAAAGQDLSLRDAVSRAQPGDTIDFNLKGGGTIKLLSTITLTGSTIFNGNGVTIQVEDTRRVNEYPLFNVNFDNPDTGKVVFNDVTLIGGAQGAMIVTAGTAELNSCVVKNTTNNSGGGLAVYAAGTLNLTDCTVTNNTAIETGGGIYCEGILNLTGCTVSSNISEESGSGISFMPGGANSSMTIVNSTIANNTSMEGSGAVYVGGTDIGSPSASSVINASTICYNTGFVTNMGSGIVNNTGLYLYNSIVAGNLPEIEARDIANYGTINGWNNAVGPSYGYTPQPGDWITDGDAASLFTYTSNNQETGYLYLDSGLKSNGGLTQTLALNNSNTIAKSINPYYPASYEVLASDGAANDYFGWSAAISGDGVTVLVGDYDDDSSRGSAYIFVHSGNSWIQQPKLKASVSAKKDRFGYAAALSKDGNIALIGAYGRNNFTGAAYIFRHSGSSWTQVDTLIPSDITANSNFGGSVAISDNGDTAVVGAFGKDKVYIFVRNVNTWEQKYSLTAKEVIEGDRFGRSVAMTGNGNMLLAGAPAADSNLGVVYVFAYDADTWVESGVLTAADRNISNPANFGRSVSLTGDGNTAVIGSWRDNSYTGSAYIFVRDGDAAWQQQAKLVASDHQAGDYFSVGISLSNDGNTVIGGAYGSDSCKGSAYVFTRNESNWSQQSKLTIPKRTDNDYLGICVALSDNGNIAVIGADGVDSKRGAVYIFYADGSDTGVIPSVDQRDFVRSTDSSRSIGAYEWGAVANSKL